MPYRAECGRVPPRVQAKGSRAPRLRKLSCPAEGLASTLRGNAYVRSERKTGRFKRGDSVVFEVALGKARSCRFRHRRRAGAHAPADRPRAGGRCSSRHKSRHRPRIGRPGCARRIRASHGRAEEHGEGSRRPRHVEPFRNAGLVDQLQRQPHHRAHRLARERRARVAAFERGLVPPHGRRCEQPRARERLAPVRRCESRRDVPSGLRLAPLHPGRAGHRRHQGTARSPTFHRPWRATRARPPPQP